MSWENQNEDELDRAIDEAFNADEIVVPENPVQTPTIKFSNGVEFTSEELELMDPEVKAKLLKVKTGDENWTRGYNAKVAELKALKAQPAQTQQVATPTPATPTGTEKPKAYEAYLYKKMAYDNFIDAKIKAEKLYGLEVVNIIGEKMSSLFKQNVDAGKYDYNFDYAFEKAFNTLLLSDERVRTSFFAFTGKGKSEEQIKQESALAAQAEILKLKQDTTTGLPTGGAAVVTPPVDRTPVTGLKAAHSRFKEEMKKLYNQK